VGTEEYNFNTTVSSTLGRHFYAGSVELEEAPSDTTPHSNKVLMNASSLIIKKTENKGCAHFLNKMHGCFNSIYVNKNVRSIRLILFSKTEKKTLPERNLIEILRVL
jgi:hypothetical protein